MLLFSAQDTVACPGHHPSINRSLLHKKDLQLLLCFPSRPSTTVANFYMMVTMMTKRRQQNDSGMVTMVKTITIAVACAMIAMMVLSPNIVVAAEAFTTTTTSSSTGGVLRSNKASSNVLPQQLNTPFTSSVRSSSSSSALTTTSSSNGSSDVQQIRGGSNSADGSNKQLVREMIAELIGTFIIVHIGTGSVMSAIYTNSLIGLFQIASVWIIGVTIAIATTASISGAHLNPAISIVFALLRPTSNFNWRKVVPYSVAQLIGAILASWTNLCLYSSSITKFEQTNNIIRASASGIESAKAFGEYYRYVTVVK